MRNVWHTNELILYMPKSHRFFNGFELISEQMFTFISLKILYETRVIYDPFKVGVVFWHFSNDLLQNYIYWYFTDNLFKDKNLNSDLLQTVQTCIESRSILKQQNAKGPNIIKTYPNKQHVFVRPANDLLLHWSVKRSKVFLSVFVPLCSYVKCQNSCKQRYQRRSNKAY